MTLVKNGYPHPYTPTIGGVLAPQEVADLGLYTQELDAIATGRLVVMDPSWQPPDTPPPPPTMGSWRGSVAAPADLPESGNAAGDVFTVLSPAGLYVWNGSAWAPVASGGGGGGGLTVLVENPVTGYQQGDISAWIGWTDPTAEAGPYDITIPVPEP